MAIIIHYNSAAGDVAPTLVDGDPIDPATLKAALDRIALLEAALLHVRQRAQADVDEVTALGL